MNNDLEILLEDFKSELSLIKKNIFSVIVHGSSVYSDELKQHQDVDIFLILKKRTYSSMKKLKKILNNFSQKKSFGNKVVYYSMAGAGRGSIERFSSEDKQIFRLEIYLDYKESFLRGWKKNFSFPHSLCKTYFILYGGDIKKYLQYVGDSENKSSIFAGFDKFQWTISSLFESDFDDFTIISSVQEGVFFDLGNLFLSNGFNERRKTHMINFCKEKFPALSKKYSIFLRNILLLREKGKINLTAKEFFDFYVRFHHDILEEINERIRTS